MPGSLSCGRLLPCLYCSTGRTRMNVLICEDDATTRLLLKSMLKKAMPCEVAEVPNGVEALALLRKKTSICFSWTS